MPEHKKAPLIQQGFSFITFSGRLRGQRAFGLFNDGVERVRLVHGKIRQHFAIHFNSGQVQAVDEAGVCQRVVVQTYSRVDPLDPQSTEIALAVLAVACCVLVGLVYGLTCNLEGVLAAAIVTFGGLDNLLVTGVSGRTTFNSGHAFSP